MCDTLFKTGDGISYFAKNSDREPSEAQYVEYYPRIDFRDQVKTTYIEVEYRGQVNAILISRPYWIWGAEMGVNEKGVAIGNEAIFSKPKHKTKSLLGMDVLRLGLEKGNTARHAVEVMEEYVEKYGIGGSNSKYHQFYYNNSFLITDGKESFILETEGKEHESKEVSKWGSISNFPSVKSYRLDSLYSRLGRGYLRQKRTSYLIEKAEDVRSIMEIMRSHHDGFTHPGNGNNEDICMHGGFLSRRDQTANSFVVEIKRDFMVVWTTYSSNPCVSLFKPVIFKDGIVIGPPLKERGYWEEAEMQHLKLFQGSQAIYESYRSKISEAQQEVFANFHPVLSALEEGDKKYKDLLEEFSRYIESLDTELIKSVGSVKKSRSLYSLWINRQMESILALVKGRTEGFQGLKTGE